MRMYDIVIEVKRGEAMKETRRARSKHFLNNLRLARRLWPNQIHSTESKALEVFLRRYRLSVGAGEILYLGRRWYVTHAGLLHLAARSRCHGIQAQQVRDFSDPVAGPWVFKAAVYTFSGSRGFVGYGDADPSNVSPLVHGAEMRVAETRAVNRALRKAYGVGLCSVEELGWSPRSSRPDRSHQDAPPANGNNGHQNGQPRLRDQLCLLIRKHQLDAALVKAYAADYCGSPALRDASKAQIGSFITHLTDWAAR